MKKARIFFIFSHFRWGFFLSQTCYKSQTTAILRGWLAGATSSSRETINWFSGGSCCLVFWVLGLLVDSQSYISLSTHCLIVTLSLPLSTWTLSPSLSLSLSLSLEDYIKTWTQESAESESVWGVGSFRCFEWIQICASNNARSCSKPLTWHTMELFSFSRKFLRVFLSAHLIM